MKAQDIMTHDINNVRSMFEHTVDRARLLISPERLLTVILRSQTKYAVLTALTSIRGVIGSSREEDAIAKAYRSIPAVYFSRSVLEHGPKRLCVREASGFY